MGKTCGFACNVYPFNGENLLLVRPVLHWFASNKYTVGPTKLFSVNICTTMLNALALDSIFMYLTCIWIWKIEMHQFSILCSTIIFATFWHTIYIIHTYMHLLCASVNWPNPMITSLTGHFVEMFKCALCMGIQFSRKFLWEISNLIQAFPINEHNNNIIKTKKCKLHLES